MVRFAAQFLPESHLQGRHEAGHGEVVAGHQLVRQPQQRTLGVQQMGQSDADGLLVACVTQRTPGTVFLPGVLPAAAVQDPAGLTYGEEAERHLLARDDRGARTSLLPQIHRRDAYP